MPKNWNRRFKHNRDKMKTGDIFELAEVVRNLSLRDHEKGLSTGEKQMFVKAKKILASELMYAKAMDEDEAAVWLDDVLSDVGANGNEEDARRPRAAASAERRAAATCPSGPSSPRPAAASGSARTARRRSRGSAAGRCSPRASSGSRAPTGSTRSSSSLRPGGRSRRSCSPRSSAAGRCVACVTGGDDARRLGARRRRARCRTTRR